PPRLGPRPGAWGPGPRPSPSCAPPRKGEKPGPDPAALIFCTNTSTPPLFVVLNAPAVVGKSGELVLPSTYALFAASTAIRVPKSTWLPPLNVEYTNLEPVGSTLVTNASQAPWR